MDQVSMFSLAQVRLPMEKNRFLLMFAGINFISTGLDVALAHSINAFVPVYELIPVYISPFCALSCILLSFQSKPRSSLAVVHLGLMALGFTVGALGTAFHGNAVLNPGGHLTWAWVVFGSPILAPLAFCGISLIGMYAATQEVRGEPGVLEVPGLGLFRAPISRERHFIWFVGLGFAGSAMTSLIDHAQYGYTAYKLIAIVFGLFATAVVITIAVSKTWTRGDEVVYFWTMIAAVVVGILGFGFHLSADLAGTGQLSLERILAFAPVFAPLLFSDLGVLGLLVVAQPQETAGKN
jgi:hypothetical protein